jgi:hypothetical protein
MQSLQVVRNGKHHVSFTALLPKPCIHGILCELTPDDGYVLGLEKLLWFSYPACAGVATPYRARVAIPKKALLIKALEPAGYASNGNVNEPGEIERIPTVAY